MAINFDDYNLSNKQIQAILMLSDPMVPIHDTVIAKEIGIADSTLCSWRNSNLSFQRCLNDLRNNILDEIKQQAKSKIANLIRKAVDKLEEVMNVKGNLTNGEARIAATTILKGCNILNDTQQVAVSEKKEVTVTHKIDRDNAIGILHQLKNVRKIKVSTEKRIPIGVMN